MSRSKSIHRQFANLWLRRLLGSLWAAADVFNLEIPAPQNEQPLTRQVMQKAALGWASNLPQTIPGLLDDIEKKDVKTILDALEKELTPGPSERDTSEGTRSPMAPPNNEAAVDPVSSWQEYRKEYLLQLGHALVLFSVKHFAFLYDGFHGFQNERRIEFADLIPNEVAASEIPAIQDLLKNLQLAGSSNVEMIDFAFRTTLNQITFDLLALNRAWVYHNPSHNKAVAKRILRADSLAQSAVAGMTDYLNGNFIALTYVDRVANVRVVPYAPVALIGIPASSLAVEQDLLAIAHEFGHFLYWNGKPTPGDLSQTASFRAWMQQQIPQKVGQPSLSHWQEEIFADVVGCLIGGPAVALSFQDMAAEKAGHLLLEDSGKHATPAARPFVYCKVLEELAMPNAAAALRKRWEAILSERLTRKPSEELPPERSEELLSDWRMAKVVVGEQKEVSLGDLSLQLEEAARKLCELFLGGDKIHAIKEHIWSQEIAALSQEEQKEPAWIEQIYKDFAERDSSVAPDFNFVSQNWDSHYDWENLVDKRGYLKQAQNGEPGGTPDQRPHSIPAENWLRVLFFDGWNTGGPTGGVPH